MTTRDYTIEQNGEQEEWMVQGPWKKRLTKSSFTQGDKAVFIRDTTIRLLEAAHKGGNGHLISVPGTYATAESLWDRFIEDLPNE